MSLGQPTAQADYDLLRRMRAGEEEAFLALYRRSQGPIYRFALHMSGSPSIAEDVTQEVFLVLIEGLDRFDPARGTLPGYLLGISRKLVLRRLEKDRAFLSLPDEEQAASANGHAAVLATAPATATNGHSRREVIARVRRATLTLPANYREVVVLCDLQEMSYEEAAEVIGCAVGTVRSRLHRARALLGGKLRELGRPEREQNFIAGPLPKIARNAS
jgi:RNA polymerase sigma-70 factor (ECF subfamily)